MDFTGTKIKSFFTKTETAPASADSEIWVRSCTQEILEPIAGKFSGKIPDWLNGSLIMNGPGKFNVGDNKYNHLFDGIGLLQRFAISSKEGKITYQNRFIKGETYKKNHENNQIMFGEFGTAAESKGLFNKLLSGASKSTDNTLVSVSPISEDFYALTEAPSVNRIDPKTLEVLENTNFSDKMGFAMLTAHPQVMEDGTAYNVGHSIGSSGGFYNFVCFPKDQRDISSPKILATIQSRFKYHPSYIHSFSITENFFIVYETPFVLSVPQLAKSLLMQVAFIDCLKWLENEQTRIILVNRETGALQFEFFTDPFFCFHSINQYEEDGNVILDLCCYENADVVDVLRVERLLKNDANAIGKFFAKPLRFVLPIRESNEKNVNLVKIESSKATAVLKEDGKFFCTPELLADITFEFPRINQPKYLSKKYKYFYGVCVELDEDVGSIVKVDAEKKSKITWKDGKIYAYEPFFVPSPNAVDEDDGVVVAGFLTSGTANQVGIVILDSKNMKELARAEFKDLPTDITKPFHGWFLADD